MSDKITPSTISPSKIYPRPLAPTFTRAADDPTTKPKPTPPPSRRDSFMIKRDAPHLVMRPPAPMAMAADRAAYNHRLRHEVRKAKPKQSSAEKTARMQAFIANRKVKKTLQRGFVRDAFNTTSQGHR